MQRKIEKQHGVQLKGRSDASAANQGRAVTVKRIRAVLNRTQAELAGALGVSAKAVQSYEQGWRAVPARVLIQLLVLLALYRRQTMADVPCWEIRRCASSQRDVCPSFSFGRGQFCWMIGVKVCKPGGGSASARVQKCMVCPVVQRLMA